MPKELKRSLIKRIVLKCLIDAYPKGLSVSEICKLTGLYVNQVVGGP